MPKERVRVIAYIDGWNLYYGIRAAKLCSSRWLDLGALSRRLLEPHQQLEMVRYFTSRARSDPADRKHQSTYIDALEAIGGIEIEYGFFQPKSIECRQCSNSWPTYEEKKTDVNMSIKLLEDAYDDLYDVAIVISGDGDLAPPVAAVRHRFPAKRVIAAFPPKRKSRELAKHANTAISIYKKSIRNSRLVTPVTTKTGTLLHAPSGWLPGT